MKSMRKGSSMWQGCQKASDEYIYRHLKDARVRIILISKRLGSSRKVDEILTIPSTPSKLSPSSQLYTKAVSLSEYRYMLDSERIVDALNPFRFLSKDASCRLCPGASIGIGGVSRLNERVLSERESCCSFPNLYSAGARNEPLHRQGPWGLVR